MDINKNLSAAVYTRMSSKRCDNNLEDEIRICTEYAESQGVNIVNKIKHMKSSDTENKNELLKLLDQDYDIIYVLSVDKLYNNSKFFQKIFFKKAYDNKIKIHFVNLDLTLNPMDKHTDYIKVYNKLLEYVKQDTVKSNIRSKSQKISIKNIKNKFPNYKFGGKARYGKKYKKLESGNRVEIDNRKEMTVLKLINLLRNKKKFNAKKKLILYKLYNNICEFYNLEKKDLDSLILLKSTVYSFNDIAKFFNNLRLKKRNKIWSASSVNNAYKNYLVIKKEKKEYIENIMILDEQMSNMEIKN